jgi:deoxyribonuclease V
LVLEAASQIPQGMVSTYGDISAALGDRAAARAVGEMLANNTMPIKVPCHRVVYSDGRTGWYGGRGRGAERKVELLRAEGVEVSNGRVIDLDRRRFSDFRIPAVLTTLREEQNKIRAMVSDHDRFDLPITLGGLDVAYEGDRAFAALAVYSWPDGSLISERVIEGVVDFPYIPTYLSYREIPILRPLITDKGLIYLIDGHGTLHPRGAGIASHLGVCLEVPTVGAAKTVLTGAVTGEGELAPVFVDGKVKGYRLGTGRKATYVSVGHRVSLGTAVDICQRLLDKGIPRPLRRAHALAAEAKGGSR